MATPSRKVAAIREAWQQEQARQMQEAAIVEEAARQADRMSTNRHERADALIQALIETQDVNHAVSDGIPDLDELFGRGK